MSRSHASIELPPPWFVMTSPTGCEWDKKGEKNAIQPDEGLPPWFWWSPQVTLTIWKMELPEDDKIPLIQHPCWRAFYTLNGYLGKYWTNVEWSVQTALTPFNIFDNRGNAVWILNESLFTLSTMLDDLFKRPQHLVQQSFERMLNRMLKPFERAFTCCSPSWTNRFLSVTFGFQTL